MKWRHLGRRCGGCWAKGCAVCRQLGGLPAGRAGRVSSSWRRCKGREPAGCGQRCRAAGRTGSGRWVGGSRGAGRGRAGAADCSIQRCCTTTRLFQTRLPEPRLGSIRKPESVINRRRFIRIGGSLGAAAQLRSHTSEQIERDTSTALFAGGGRASQPAPEAAAVSSEQCDRKLGGYITDGSPCASNSCP